MKSLIIDTIIYFLTVLVVASIVTFLWNLVFHATSSVDWETSFRLAIIFGIVFPWIRVRERKEREKGNQDSPTIE